MQSSKLIYIFYFIQNLGEVLTICMAFYVLFVMDD